MCQCKYKFTKKTYSAITVQFCIQVANMQNTFVSTFFFLDLSWILQSKATVKYVNLMFLHGTWNRHTCATLLPDMIAIWTRFQARKDAKFLSRNNQNHSTIVARNERGKNMTDCIQRCVRSMLTAEIIIKPPRNMPWNSHLHYQPL